MRKPDHKWKQSGPDEVYCRACGLEPHHLEAANGCMQPELPGMPEDWYAEHGVRKETHANR